MLIDIFGHIHTLRFVVVVIFITFLVKFQKLTFVGVNFLVKFKYFTHIHSVILNRSSEYSSIKDPVKIH